MAVRGEARKGARSSDQLSPLLAVRGGDRVVSRDECRLCRGRYRRENIRRRADGHGSSDRCGTAVRGERRRWPFSSRRNSCPSRRDSSAATSARFLGQRRLRAGPCLSPDGCAWNAAARARSRRRGRLARHRQQPAQPCDDAQRSRCRASTQYSRDPAQGGGARRHLRRTTRIKAAYSGHYERLVALRNNTTRRTCSGSTRTSGQHCR